MTYSNLPTKALVVTASLVPTATLAEVCDKERPTWNGDPATALTEAIALLTTLPAIGLLVLSALAFRLRHQWLGLAVVVGWCGLVSLVTLAPQTKIDQAAVAEGCVGPSWLFVAIAIAICAALVLRTSPTTKD